MNRDPFDSLRARNPVRPESLPDAPMTVASRITAGRPTLRRGLAIAGATALAVLAAGSAWLLWTSGGGRETAIEMTTTTLAEVSTTAIGTAEEDAPILVVYFLDSDTNTLVPVARNLNVLDVRPLPDVGPLTLELLISGPGAWDAAPLPNPVAAAEAELTSAIPAGTSLLGLQITNGLAVVDLSREFATASPEALAQVVFTLTRLDGVDRVRFLIEGSPHSVLAETLGLAPATPLPSGATVVDPVTQLNFESLLPPLMIEMPALGGDFNRIAIGVAYPDGASIGVTLHDSTGALIWAGEADTVTCGTPWSDCRGEGDWSVFTAIVEGSIPTDQWSTISAFLYDAQGEPQAEISYPVWQESPSQNEVTTTTTTTTTTTIPSAITANAAPWSAQPLAENALPAVAADTWATAENAQSCALLFPADPGALANGAVLHDRYFGGGWGLAWDLPSGPGRWEPGGDYCADCGREAFGVAGTGGDAHGAEDAIWPSRLEWTADSANGPLYSHAGYGYEGLTSDSAGEPMLAYLFIDGQGCMYNVWSFLGEEHLLALIEQLRFVEGMGAFPASP